MSGQDKTLSHLFDLDGVRFVIDERLGLWVKFEAKVVERTLDRPHGMRYSLSLHDRFNNRIMGFDNAHAVSYGKKVNVASKRTHDHWHRDESDAGFPYDYKNAGKLLEDFWTQVEKIMQKLGAG